MWRPVLASLFFSMNLSAKEPRPVTRKAALGATFVLKQSESAAVAGIFEIRFLKITEDSRCPSDVRCGVAGRALGLFAVNRKGAVPVTIQIDANPYSPPAVYSDHEIRFMDLTPRPLSTRKSSQNEYAATLLVSRAK